MTEHELVFEREGEEYLRQDYEVTRGGELPELPSEPSGYKIIIKDDEGNYYSTYIYENLDEAVGDAAGTLARYGLERDDCTLIISVYFKS